MHPRVLEVTRRIQARSVATRQRYLEWSGRRPAAAPRHPAVRQPRPQQGRGLWRKRQDPAADEPGQRGHRFRLQRHALERQPFERFPGLIKQALHEIGSVGQFAGGVPAMCDGVTQGEPGMELSLASRDVIAMSTPPSRCCNMFDAALCLGVCDKIVPGLLIGSLRFGHLPTVFVPAGPMPTGISNKEKAAVRQLFARARPLSRRAAGLEWPPLPCRGTCTFYGTANTNQLLVEVMGLHFAGASFVNPNTPLRDGLTREAARQASRLTPENGNYVPMAEIVDGEGHRQLGGGAARHRRLDQPRYPAPAGDRPGGGHPVDLAGHVRAVPCGADPGAHLSEQPEAASSHFQAAGGMSFLIRQLLDGGLLHEDVQTVAGPGLRRYPEPFLEDGRLVWRERARTESRRSHPRPLDKPFSARRRPPDGGQPRSRRDEGLAVAPEHQVVEAPVRIFHDQASLARPSRPASWSATWSPLVRFPGPAGERHAGAAQAHAVPRGLAGSVASRWRWSPTTCPGRRARCPRPSM